MKLLDQLHREVELPSSPPKRIVSLVPSQTELLFDLGLDDEVIGITKFCVHPENWFRNKTRIGGTKKLDLSLIRELQPDLIIANKEENLRVQVEELAREYPVWISDVRNLEEAYDMIKCIGALVGKAKKSEELTSRIKSNFNKGIGGHGKLRTIYLIWKDPYMTVGGDTFISDMMKHAGFENVFQNQTRYPEISIHQLSSVDCQLVLLSSEPFPFNEKHIQDLRFHLPHVTMHLVDGEMFSWYGSRLQYAPAYFAQLQELGFNR